MIIATTITAVAISMASYHTNRHHVPRYNEINPGATVEFDGKYVVGAYLNSHKRVTVLAIRHFDIGNAGPVNFGANLGVGTGYGVPVLASIEARLGPLAVHLMPAQRGKSAAFGFNYRINVGG